jgi:multidrug efflux pump subunit AcrB
VARITKQTPSTKPKDKLLPKLTLFFFDRTRTAALIWLLIASFGVLSYTTFLKREGFPSVNFPLVMVSGVYAVDNPAEVDRTIAKPITDVALKQPNVDTVTTSTTGNFTSIFIQYKEGVQGKAAGDALKEAVKANTSLPEQAVISYAAPEFSVTGPSDRKVDEAISFYAKDDGVDTAELARQAAVAAEWLNDQKLPLVKEFFVINPYEQAVDPATGTAATVQRTFDRFGKRQDGNTIFRNSVLIGVTAVDKADVITLDDQVREAMAELRGQSQFAAYDVTVSATYAESIKENISELQRVLLEGLLAILVIGSVIIALRASIITVIAMITVLAVTLGLLYLFGYTLNVITLFALILSLSLIVDDTIIMVEAIDAARKRNKSARAAVAEATRKISRAMVAATSTAALSFAPLLFVGGILGSFIRAIPVTIIAALVVSLFVALVFIPMFARRLMLGPKQMGEEGVRELAAGLEARIARFIAKPMLWARGSRRKLYAVGITALVIGFGFIGAAGFVGRYVVFNIFPPSKDTNGVMVTLSYPQGTTVAQAEAIAARADKLTTDVLGNNLVKSSYYGQGGAQNSTAYTDIISYEHREVTSPQLVEKLQDRFDKDFKEARALVAQIDVGPPPADFRVRIESENRAAAVKLANDIAAYMTNRELTRPSGEKARVTKVNVSRDDLYQRADGKLNVSVQASFDGTDTSTLVTLAQSAVKDKFTPKVVQGYGLKADALQFDFGQESENQDSFKTLAYAFPLLLCVIYVLLAIQFRSLLQPLLIFMALPFSLFGVTLGLYLSDNPFSFFAMLGFFALIGLSIKNTILLTDYANQARRDGMNAVDAAVEALSERFRPLIATSITAVVSLIPLAVTSPFWQGLAMVLICGLLSSTFLVITVFPYYYLGAEHLRTRISRKAFFEWLIVSVAVIAALQHFFGLQGALYGLLWSVVAAIGLAFARRRWLKA